eukprot:7307244-Pyramimonas_sp.AAC.1
MSSDYIEPLAQTHNVALPKKFCFNHEIGIDCLEVKDDSGERCTFLNIVCQGTTLQRVIFVKQGEGAPSPRACLTAWAGKPKRVVLERGLHNRGVFLQCVKSQGIDLRDAGVESPEQIGCTERHGGIWKNIFKKV